MPYLGNGTYQLPTSYNPVVTGTTISSTAFNTTMTDVAGALSTCLTKDGQQTPTANIPMGGYKFTRLLAGSTTGDSVSWEQVFTNPVFPNATLANPTMTGTVTMSGATSVTIPTPSPTDNSLKAVNSAWVSGYVFTAAGVPAWYAGLVFMQNGMR
jgi:hypothetical protein